MPTSAVQPKPKKTKKKPEVPAIAQAVQPPAQPPQQPVASTAPPPSALIGNLTSGGDAAPAEQERASEQISTVEKSVNGWSGTAAMQSDEQKEGLRRVRNFLRQAREALNSGDVEGASQLATKAKLLLDDLMK